MNDDTNREPPIPTTPPDTSSPDAAPDDAVPVHASPPATSAEDVPEWLLRIRAKREVERNAKAAQSGAAVSAAPGDAPLPTDEETPPEAAEDLPDSKPPDQPEAAATDAAFLTSPAGPALATETAGEAGEIDEAPDWVKDLPPTTDDPSLESGDSATSLSATPQPAGGLPTDTPAWLQDVVAAKTAASLDKPAPPAVEAPHAPPLAEAPVKAKPAEPPTPAESVRERRARRRRERRTEARRTSTLGNTIQSLAVVGAAAVLIATIFTFWTPANFLSEETREGLRPAYATLSAQSPPTPVPTPAWMRRIGIVSGHWGPHPSTGRSDPGAVCEDGLTEAEVNRNVATIAVQILSGMGYDVDLLDEWDPRLDDYQASVLLSIHADSCHEFDLPGATGFKVAPPSGRTSARADDIRLHDCLVQHYGEITGLPIHPSLTRDMTEYHSFQEISSITPASIIELGFLFEDRDMLENHPDVLAEGIIAGVKCFLDNAPPTPLPEVTPWPTIDATPTPLETPGLS